MSTLNNDGVINLKGSKVLVTGAAGFLATNFIFRLVNEGADVVATYHINPLKINVKNVEYIQVDLKDFSQCEKVVEGVDYVFHCAANTQGAGVIATTPMMHVTPNVVMNTYLLEAAYLAGVKKFTFISSGAAYPDTGTKPAIESDMLTTEPSEVYYAVAWMKRYAEILCETYAIKLKKIMPCLVIRPSNIYGPWDKFDPNSSHVTAATIRKVVEKQNPIEVWGTGDDIRDLIYIDDFIDGCMMAFTCDDDYLAINICSGKGVSVKGILDAAIEAENYQNPDIQFNTSKPSTVNVRLLSNEMAKKKLGFIASTSLVDGIGKTCQWLRKHSEALAVQEYNNKDFGDCDEQCNDAR